MNNSPQEKNSIPPTPRNHEYKSLTSEEMNIINSGLTPSNIATGNISLENIQLLIDIQNDKSFTTEQLNFRYNILTRKYLPPALIAQDILYLLEAINLTKSLGLSELTKSTLILLINRSVSENITGEKILMTVKVQTSKSLSKSTPLAPPAQKKEYIPRQIKGLSDRIKNILKDVP